AAARPGSWQRLDFDREHGRQVPHDRRPAGTGNGRRIHLPAGGAEVDAARVKRVHSHRIPQDVDVAVALRQAFGQRLPFVAARPAAVYAELAVEGIVLRVALDRGYVDRVRLVRVHIDDESEVRR